MTLKYWLLGIILGIAVIYAHGRAEAEPAQSIETDCSAPLPVGSHRVTTIVADSRVVQRCRYA